MASDPQKNGHTLWDMLVQKCKPSPAPVAFHNPLELRINSPVAVAHVNGPEFEGYDFSVREIRECVRRIGGQEFGFTDYDLHGINTKTFSHDDELTVRLRVFPNEHGSNDALLLRLFDELSFSEDFLAVVRDTTGIFEVADETTGGKETFTRINDVEGSYEVAALIITATTEDGKGMPGGAKTGKFEYWDYWREAETRGGNLARQYLFVEMNSDSGWFQLWRGAEFFR